MTYKVIPLSVSVSLEDDNPVFGRSVTIVSIDDESGGPFISLEQSDDDTELGKVKFDLAELDLVCKAARKLMKQYEAKQK